MEKPHSVAVTIAGREYRILSDGDDEALHEVAAYVDAAMRRIRQHTGTVDSLQLAVLTSLNFARQLMVLRGSARNAPDTLDDVDAERLRSLIEKVESVSASAGASSEARA